GNCYLLTLTGTDNVGNATSVSTTVKVDTTLASGPTSFSVTSPTNAYFPGTGTKVYFKSGAAGGFTLVAAGASDSDTGVTGYAYGAIAGTGWANTLGAYTFTTASPTGSAVVTSINGAGTTGGGGTFTAQADSTLPAGGAFSANGTAATAGTSTSYI